MWDLHVFLASMMGFLFSSVECQIRSCSFDHWKWRNFRGNYRSDCTSSKASISFRGRSSISSLSKQCFPYSVYWTWMPSTLCILVCAVVVLAYTLLWLYVVHQLLSFAHRYFFLEKSFIIMLWYIAIILHIGKWGTFVSLNK